MAVSDAKAYAIGGMTQIASPRQPGAAASQVHKDRRRDRADVQQPGPDRPLAMQRQRDAQRGEHQAAASGIAASSAAITRIALVAEHHQVLGRERHDGGAAASTPRAIIALRSQTRRAVFRLPLATTPAEPSAPAPSWSNKTVLVAVPSSWRWNRAPRT